MRSLLRQHRSMSVKVGLILVAASYVLLAPVLLLCALGLSGQAGMWCRVAGVTYVSSWVLFIAGFLMAGRGAARSFRQWAAKSLGREEASSPETGAD